MSGSVRVLFDGEVLRPEVPMHLRPYATYIITIEREVPAIASVTDAEYPLTAIRRLATDMGVTDLAARHDHYAHRRVDTDTDAR